MTTMYAQGVLTGSITNQNGQPLIGAHIVLKNSKETTVSDFNGRYKFEDVAAGKQVVEVSYIGYTTQSNEIYVEGTTTYTLNFKLAEAAFSIDELLVTSTKVNNATPVTFTNVDQEEITALNNGQDIPYLLQFTPSLVVTSDAGAGVGYTGMRIRGSDAQRINVTINGIPLNDSESHGVFWVNLPDFASSTSDIQIQRGVGTSKNGGGAFGASINVNTQQVKEEAHAAVNLSGGSFNTLRRNVTFGTGLLGGHWVVDGRLSRITSDGYIDRASSDLESYQATAQYIADKSRLTFNIFSGHEVTYQAWDGVSPDLLDTLRTHNPVGEKADGSFYDREVDDYGQTHYQLLFDHEFNRNWHLNAGLHYTKGGGYFEQYKVGEDFEDYNLTPIVVGGEEINTTDLIRRRWLDNHFYGGIYALDYTSEDKRLAVTLGGAYNQYLGDHFGEIIWARHASQSEIRDRYYENDAQKDDFTTYAKANYLFSDKFSAFVDLQYRNVRYEYFGFNEDAEAAQAEANLSFFNPKAGLVYRLTELSQVYASFAIGNKEPNRDDYTENISGQIPEAETLQDVELGWRQNTEKSAFEANLYFMNYQNQLVATGRLNDVGENVRANVESSYRAGIELSAKSQVTPSLLVSANATFSQNKITDLVQYVDTYEADWSWIGQTEVKFDETDLPFSPNVIAGAGVQYDILPMNEKRGLDVAVDWRYVGQQYLDLSGSEDNILEAYNYANLRMNYTFKTKLVKEVRLSFAVNNVLDQLYESNGWSYKAIVGGNTQYQQGLYPQAGRHFFFGVNVAF